MLAVYILLCIVYLCYLFPTFVFRSLVQIKQLHVWCQHKKSVRHFRVLFFVSFNFWAVYVKRDQADLCVFFSCCSYFFLKTQIISPPLAGGNQYTSWLLSLFWRYRNHEAFNENNNNKNNFRSRNSRKKKYFIKNSQPTSALNPRVSSKSDQGRIAWKEIDVILHIYWFKKLLVFDFILRVCAVLIIYVVFFLLKVVI